MYVINLFKVYKFFKIIDFQNLLLSTSNWVHFIINPVFPIK